MKKVILAIMVLLMPLNVLAYSSEVYLGGNTLGIEISSDGILIIGFYEINGKINKGNPKLKVGDYIKEVNGVEVNNLNELTKEIEKSKDEGKVTITYKRDNNLKKTTLNLIKDEGIYKTGLYVKDSIIGIGTLTYIDPKSNIYGALGHEIIESNSNSIIEVKSGSIFRNSITSIDKSKVGYAGSKNAKYYYDTIYGSIYKNTVHGIFGKYTGNTNNYNLISVAKKDEVKVGSAKIYTVLSGEKIEEYGINITSINETSNTKNINFEINDKNLIKETGGIIQGMSGSPIVQNNKIVGVVTHVIIDNPLTGYGLFIETMLNEGEN